MGFRAGAGATVHEYADYDALGRVSLVRDALGNTQSFRYDARDQVRFAIDAEGYATETVYDGLDRVVETIQPEGIRVTYGYDASSRRVLYRDALGGETLWTYDALDRVTGVTYPDQTTWTYGYDAGHNRVQTVDANGTVLTQTFDLPRRLTGRTVTTAGAGLVGPLSEAFTYDGLNRMVSAQSGSVVTGLVYDSLSRKLSETTGGQTVTFGLDAVGNRTAIGYPSGRAITQTFDGLDRPLTVWVDDDTIPAVDYGYRGPYLRSSATYGNGVQGDRTFDAARRRIGDVQTTAGGAKVFDESLSWSPRSLMTGSTRGDVVGRDSAWSYDGAQRLVSSEEGASTTGFTYDAAQNLLARRKAEGELVEDEVLTPRDPSGRNRPASINGVPLVWDANGNLRQKGDTTFAYDFRNRLTTVTRSGQTVASYTYDAFNRRTSASFGGTTETNAWMDLRPVEVLRDGQLHQRRVYGQGLDEVVRLDNDLDADGSLDPPQVPHYDAVGNVSLLTGQTGKPVERYTYDDFGARAVWADLNPPVVEQVRVEGGSVILELSEPVLPDPLAAAEGAGEITLTRPVDSTDFPLTATQPVTEGRHAGRRVVLSVGGGSLPDAGDEVTLTVSAEAFRDEFLNEATTDFDLTFSWPASDAVLEDSAPPQVTRVALRDGVLEIELTEPVTVATANTSILVDDEPVTWTADADGYRLTADEELSGGSHDLAIGLGLTDLSGTSPLLAWDETFEVTSSNRSRLLFEAPDPRLVPVSTVGNDLGFHGLPEDEVTGLVYARNRYLDPELGRFISADPLGYVDGPSVYAYAGNSPTNYGDPFGLQKVQLERVYAPLLLDVTVVIVGDSWSEAEVEEQMVAAEKVFGDEAGILLNWRVQHVDSHPLGATRREYVTYALERAGRDRESYEHTPIFFTQPPIPINQRWQGAAVPPKPRGAAVVYSVDKVDRLAAAHELGHAIGNLCDPIPADRECGWSPVKPEADSLMFPVYDYSQYREVLGDTLTPEEVSKARAAVRKLLSASERGPR